MAPSKESFSSQVGRATPSSPKWVDGRALSAGVAESYTVPAGINLIEVASSAGVYLNFSGGTAAAPTDLSDGTASVVVPSTNVARYKVAPGDVISLLWSATSLVSISGWKE